MPELDDFDIINVDSIGNPIYRDDLFRKKAEWRLRYLWWPRRCDISGRRMWLEWAYQGVLIVRGPNYFTRYHSTVEHVIWLLKGE
jgi:hypothetical protein